MKATVVQIESGSKYIDKERRIEIRFADADTGAFSNTLRFAESKLGIPGLKLDDVLDVSIVTEREMGEFKRQLSHICSCGDNYAGYPLPGDLPTEQQLDSTCPVHGNPIVTEREMGIFKRELADDAARAVGLECTCNGKSQTAVGEYCAVHYPVRGSKQEGCAS